MLLAQILKKFNLFIILIFLIPLILNIIWFRSGNIMGVAESGLPFHNFQMAYESNKSAWNNYTLGYPTNISISAKPIYWFLAQLQNAGIPGFILQAVFFWLTFVISGLSIYFITKNLFPDLTDKFLFLAVLFYWFNPISMINIWNRFLNNFFVFYMLLPLCFLLFLKGVQTRRYIYSILIGLVSVILSYALSSVAFNILLWLSLLYIAIFYIFFQKKPKETLYIIKFFALALFFWCLSNLWWISQVFSYAYSGSFSVVQQTSFSSGSNLEIYKILSQRLGNIVHILRFEHASFFGTNSEIGWIGLYNFPVINYLFFIVPMVIFLPLIRKVKKNSVLFLSGLVILSIFLSKGNNPPFGELFNLAFTKLSFLQALRNSFEKFGFLLQLGASPLFAVGVFMIYQWFGRRWQKYVYLTFCLWLVIIFGFPFWTGLIFTGTEIPTKIPYIGYQTMVPGYYKKAGDWLKSQTKDFRLIVLPLGGEGITYRWEKGYAGVELSNQLFPVTSVSFQTNTPFYNNISSDLERVFLNKGDFTKIMNVLNTKYVMLRNDIDWSLRRMRDPSRIYNELRAKEKKGQLKLTNSFGALTFWENPNWVDNKIYSTSQVILSSPESNISDAQFLTNQAGVLIGSETKEKKLPVLREVIHPKATLSLTSIRGTNSEKTQAVFPHTKFSPTSIVYNFILLKEKLELNAITDIFQKFDFSIQRIGKRLVEAKLEAEVSRPEGVIIALDKYEQLLEEITSTIFQDSQLKKDYSNQLRQQEELVRIFSAHKAVLKDLQKAFPDNKTVINRIEQTQKFLDAKLINIFIEPKFGFREGEGFPANKRTVHKFNILNSGDYELFLGDNNWSKYYQNEDKVNIQVDDQIISRVVTINSSGLRSYGKLYLTAGIHEIGFNTPDEINLIDAPSEINLKVVHGKDERAFPIDNYSPYATYTVSLNYWTKTGTGVRVQVLGNNSLIDLGRVFYDFSKNLSPDHYDYREKQFSAFFKLSERTDSAKLLLSVEPWNNCESVFFTRNKSRCENKNVRQPYDRVTEVDVKNVSVTRDMVDKPFLIKSNDIPANSSPQISFEKIDNTKYIVSVKDAKEPFALILSELFDPGWKLFTTEGDELKAEHFLANTYANGWEIDKVGSYQLIIRFAPQDLLDLTVKVSKAVFFIGIILLIWDFRRRYAKNH